MLVKCAECGAHVRKDVALEIPDGAEMRLYCSTACADAAEREAEGAVEPTPLPEPPQRILVATDGSGPAFRAVEHAAMLAGLCGAEVELLHVVGSGWLRTLGMAAPTSAAARLGIRTDELAKALEEQGGAQLERGKRICENAGVTCRTRVVMGTPVDAIVEASKQVDLIVMGSRGLDAIVGTLLGSLTQRVVGQAEAPVLVVH